ncbi:UNVERIFIED_CONTAM: ABC-2 type transport system ATP-binding protein [Acetivibrio alkalicellulosi]
MIKVSELIKYYGKNQVLKKTTFEVKENEIFGLLGPNGAGKTTTLECMEGLRAYDKGDIKLMGNNPEQALKKGLIGIQLQSSSLPSNITPKDAMNLFCKWNKVLVRYDLLDLFGLKDMYNKQYKTMSTGQKRRLHLALALAHSPKILFLDEPTAGLDVEAKVALHEEITKLKERGVTIILASHDMAEVETLCDRVGILVNGIVKKIGTPAEIIHEVRRESSIKMMLNQEISEKQLKTLKLVKNKNGYYVLKTENVLEGLEELIGFIRKNQYELIDLSIDKPTLEERFIEIAKGEN